MPPTLHATRFTRETQRDIQSFECGTGVVARDMTDWITGPRCFASMERGAEVWIFRDDNGAIVGFGAVGTTRWRLPNQQSPFEAVAIIPAFAVHSSFQGPRGLPREEKHSWSILRFLIARARTFGVQKLVLKVHEENVSAMSLYEAAGFSYLLDTHQNHRKMILDLSTDE